MNRNYVAYAYVYVYVSYKNEILKKREDVGKSLGGYWEEVGRTATNRRNAMRRAEANAKWGALDFEQELCSIRMQLAGAANGWLGHWILNRNFATRRGWLGPPTAG